MFRFSIIHKKSVIKYVTNVEHLQGSKFLNHACNHSYKSINKYYGLLYNK